MRVSALTPVCPLGRDVRRRCRYARAFLHVAGAPERLDRRLLRRSIMLFGRLRTPVERALAPEPRDRFESGFHVVAELSQSERVETPHHPLTLVRSLDDEFEGLDRLDREELDE